MRVIGLEIDRPEPDEDDAVLANPVRIAEVTGAIKIDGGPLARLAEAFQAANHAVARAITSMVESMTSASISFEAIGQAIADGLAAGINDREYWRPRDDAPRVRPVGRRSNSRDWLAWDYRTNAWRAVVRHQGGEWWWK